jgi:hypothetical protein
MLKLRSLLLAVVILSVTGCLIRPVGHGESDRGHDNRQGQGHGEDQGHGKGSDRGHGEGHD